ncbi:MAG: MarR family transcriptional regulator [Pseudomonadota bacterium]
MAKFDDISTPAPQRIADALERIGTAARGAVRAETMARGLNPTQAALLNLIRGRGPLSVGDTARALGLRQPTVSDSADALATKGLLERRPGPHDRRAKVLTLTPKGQAEAASLSSPPAPIVRAATQIKDDQQDALLRSLVVMIRTLQLSGAIAPQRMCVTCHHFRPNPAENTRLPYFCSLVGAPFGDRHLRVDCPEHEAASDDEAEVAWRRFEAAQNPPADH